MHYIRARAHWLSLASLGLVVLLASACSGDGTSEPATKPLPVLTDVSPSLIVAGSGVTTLTLKGSGFVRSSQARWNDSDRATHYQDEHTLAVDLLATDVATLASAKITVVNGPPGGGTSGSMTVAVGYPVPKIVSITPSSVPMQPLFGSATSITITGSGFVNGSAVRLGTNTIPPLSVSPTQIVANISSYYLEKPGTLALTVVNPSPGGGSSNAVDLSVAYPVPTITSISPDSAFTGAALTLTVNGTGFGSSSVVRWNGADRPTTFVSSTRITATIAATDVPSPATVTVTVVNPAPGGGASNAITYPVRERAPSIGGISPGTITAGAGATVVTITGTNFRAGATAQWDGQDRGASVTSSTSMTVSLLASDVVSARVGRITVTNPGASGVSNAMSLAVIPASPALSVARTITLTHTDLAYDETRGLLYASVPGSAAQYGNTVVAIDPQSGAVTKAVSVGSNPSPVAITDDGQYLYVGLTGAPKIVRVALSSFTVDLEISIPGDGFLGSAYAEDIVPIPGLPRTIAVSTRYSGVSPRNAGTILFDDNVARSARGSDHTGSNRITRGLNASRIYGYNNETTEFGFRSVLVTPDGLREETVKSGLVGGFGVDIEYSGGFVYATTGEVVDVAAMQKFGTIPANGVVRPDAANARVHFASGTTISTYHYTTFAGIGTFSNAALASHTRLVRWGTDGLAVGGGSTIVLLRGSLVGP